jgi:hypothetical protein
MRRPEPAIYVADAFARMTGDEVDGIFEPVMQRQREYVATTLREQLDIVRVEESLVKFKSVFNRVFLHK